MRDYVNSGVKVVRTKAKRYLAPVASAASGMLGGRQDNIGGKAQQVRAGGVTASQSSPTALGRNGVLVATASAADQTRPETRVPLGYPGVLDADDLITAAEQDAEDRETAGENFHG